MVLPKDVEKLDRAFLNHDSRLYNTVNACLVYDGARPAFLPEPNGPLFELVHEALKGSRALCARTIMHENHPTVVVINKKNKETMRLAEQLESVHWPMDNSDREWQLHQMIARLFGYTCWKTTTRYTNKMVYNINLIARDAHIQHEILGYYCKSLDKDILEQYEEARKCVIRRFKMELDLNVKVMAA